ncbi:MAG: hypothetical protein R6W70_09265, partial [bacterium]
MLDGKSILITGGTGSFGTCFIKKIFEKNQVTYRARKETGNLACATLSRPDPGLVRLHRNHKGGTYLGAAGHGNWHQVWLDTP